MNLHRLSAAPSCSPECRNSHRNVPINRVRVVIVSAVNDAPSENVNKRNIVTSLLTLGLISTSRPATATEGFLRSTGARGILPDEEEKLLRLRQEVEGEARKVLEDERVKFERESRLTQEGKLCGTPFGIDVVGITEALAIIGALVGGVVARQRKEELEKLNEQLRKINLQLRQQARAGTIYAPGLTYAPPQMAGGESSAMLRGASLQPGSGTATLVSPAVASAVAAPVMASAAAPVISTTVFSMEEDDMSQDQVACRDALRAGKRLLKEKNGAASMVRFEKALMLSKALSDRVQERRANRGLAAAARLQGQNRTAIKHLERVLDISREMAEYTGDADAYGTIADCYTDMGEFEKAAQFYDKYISCMNSADGRPV
jgi:tetratricopeptide (TPR) repeat protein